MREQQGTSLTDEKGYIRKEGLLKPQGMLGRAGVGLEVSQWDWVTSEGTREPAMVLEQREAIYLAGKENCRAKGRK